MRLGAPSYLSFNVAWTSELFVFRCGLHASFRNGLELLRPCFVLLMLDGTFVSLFNVDWILQPILSFAGDWIIQPILSFAGDWILFV